MAAPDATIAPVRAALTVRARVTPEQRYTSRVAALGGRDMDPLGDESPEHGQLQASLPSDGKRPTAMCGNPPASPRLATIASERVWLGGPMDDLDLASEDGLSRLQLPDLRVSVTHRALSYVHFFSGTDRGRRMFETWLKRSGRYQELIRAALRESRLPEYLLWVAMIESGFDPRATSPAGAVGLWQFMPSTGGAYGLARSSMVDERRNPVRATRAAASHFRDLFLRFGNWDLALAAYNMGDEQLVDAIDRYGTSDFAELARRAAIPAETAAYVPKVAAAAIIANNLDRFGFDTVDLARPVEAGEIAVPAGVSLSLVARAAGVATSVVRTLNPDLLHDRVPNGRVDHLVMVPIGSVSQARAALPALIARDRSAMSGVEPVGPFNVSEGRHLFARQRRRTDDDLVFGLLAHSRHRYFPDAHDRDRRRGDQIGAGAR
jgi:membrane-bound lytic murein transglycosylase D